MSDEKAMRRELATYRGVALCLGGGFLGVAAARGIAGDGPGVYVGAAIGVVVGLWLAVSNYREAR